MQTRTNTRNAHGNKLIDCNAILGHYQVFTPGEKWPPWKWNGGSGRIWPSRPHFGRGSCSVWENSAGCATLRILPRKLCAERKTASAFQAKISGHKEMLTTNDLQRFQAEQREKYRLFQDQQEASRREWQEKQEDRKWRMRKWQLAFAVLAAAFALLGAAISRYLPS